MNTKLQMAAAKVLDETHSASSARGIAAARWTLACWLDGQKVKASYVLALIKYLRVAVR